MILKVNIRVETTLWFFLCWKWNHNPIYLSSFWRSPTHIGPLWRSCKRQNNQLAEKSLIFQPGFENLNSDVSIFDMQNPFISNGFIYAHLGSVLPKSHKKTCISRKICGNQPAMIFSPMSSRKPCSPVLYSVNSNESKDPNLKSWDCHFMNNWWIVKIDMIPFWKFEHVR